MSVAPAPATTPAPVVPRQPRPSFLFIGHDGPDAARLRVEHLDGHIAHVERYWDRYVAAGPLRRPGADSLSASALIILAQSEDEAWSIVRADPYFIAGLWARTEMWDMTLSIGLFIGGKIWESAETVRARAAG